MSNERLLMQHELYATGTKGRVVALELGIRVTSCAAAPWAATWQIGARIADGGIDVGHQATLDRLRQRLV